MYVGIRDAEVTPMLRNIFIAVLQAKKFGCLGIAGVRV